MQESHKKLCNVYPLKQTRASHRVWANDVRLMRTIDGRTHRQICRLFDRANKDPFWCKNILSPSTLRKQWDKLVLKFAEIPQGEDCLPAQAHWNSPEAWENTL